MELLSNRRKGSLLSRSSSAAKSGTEFHLRQPERSGLSRRHEDLAKRHAVFHSAVALVSVCIAGGAMIQGLKVERVIRVLDQLNGENNPRGS